jgi:hypothetical protein
VYEAFRARLDKRAPLDLYHSALEVCIPEVRFVIEMTPCLGGDGAQRGVVAEGAVGSRMAGHLKIFRYEVRRWGEGLIADVDEAIDSPQRLTDDLDRARRLLELVPSVPTPVWGRDELRAGEMWNSNSVISWLLARSGLSPNAALPEHGRAPGWEAGLVIAGRGPSTQRAELAEAERAHRELARRIGYEL